MTIINCCMLAKRCVAIRRIIANRYFSDSANLSKLRNIGIIAHIDAGKTTTTERMLYYSGFTPTMGEVHDGDTITDYMPQERERGITITSATISFMWNNHKINLIDTPGHVDFTVEVERSLRVLDGAVTVLDASAGVEAQTLTVWKQADRYSLPRIIYLNKMDKPRANFVACLEDIENKFNIKPLVCQFPAINPNNNQFCGVFDLVSMTELVWSTSDKSSGEKFMIIPLEKSRLKNEALEKRVQLIEDLGALDDEFAEKFALTNEQPTEKDMQDVIRKVTCENTGIPLFCGSSYKNIGVQPLLDAVVNYLPDPTSSVPEEVTKYFNKDDTVALAFKIIHTKHEGALTFARIYSGSLRRGNRIYNMNRGSSEQCGQLFEANADEFTSVSNAEKGSIVAISGLKEAMTGDTLVGSASEASKAETEAKNKSALLFGISKIEPVFQCSIEPPSLRHQNQLDHALRCLQREDPSLKVEYQEETGQTILSGMGALQIEIIKDRIKREYNVDPYLGQLQISYREALQESLKYQFIEVDKNLGGKRHKVEIGFDLRKLPPNSEQSNFVIQPTEENNLQNLKSYHRKALINGVTSAFGHGPLLGFPVISYQVMLNHFVTSPSTDISVITAAMSQCIQKALRKACSDSKIDLLEPFMKLEITCPSDYVSAVMSDLSRRRALIGTIGQEGSMRVVDAVCPLAELIQYSTDLRTITSGRAFFTMGIDSYRIMTPTEREEAIRKASGYL